MSGRVMMPTIPDAVVRLVADAEGELGQAFCRIDAIEAENTQKVLRALQRHRISARHFAATTGYGYGDIGRDALSDVMADLMGAEAALVRPQIASGTHALALCLYGLLRPGDALVSAAGKPYDTLEQVIAAGDGSLADFGVAYRQVELAGGRIDLPALLAAMDDRARVVLIQRSRGYDWRPSLSLDEVGHAAAAIHAAWPNAVVMVDNCYGEFTDVREPGDVGADVAAGSLIKNP
ncbi:MAG: hypothetical protein GX558_10355, partial [Clostridiales bacterium]|nr:hypothetical protein [Clostridiales bacterium]